MGIHTKFITGVAYEEEEEKRNWGIVQRKLPFYWEYLTPLKGKLNI